jgi:hypothetical protein
MTSKRITAITSTAAAIISRWLALVALSLVTITACSSAAAQNLSGVYGGGNCPMKLTFRPKGVVYIDVVQEIFGSKPPEMPGQYNVDGDKVAVTTATGGVVFTRKGNTLEESATLMGRDTTFVCTKLTDEVLAQMAAKCFQYDPHAPTSYNKNNVCFDTGPVPVLPAILPAYFAGSGTTLPETVTVSVAKGGPGWKAGQVQGAVASTMANDFSVKGNPALLLVHVSPDGRVDYPHVWALSSDVYTYAEHAKNIAISLHWHPAQKNGKAVESFVVWEFQGVPPAAFGFISINVTERKGCYQILIDGQTVLAINCVATEAAPSVLPLLASYPIRVGQHTITVRNFSNAATDTVLVSAGSTLVKSYDLVMRTKGK